MEKKMEYNDNEEAEIELEPDPEMIDALLNIRDFNARIFLTLDSNISRDLNIYRELMGDMEIDTAERLLIKHQGSLKMNVEGELSIDSVKELLIMHQSALLETLNNNKDKEE